MMDTVLKELASVRGAIGSFVYFEHVGIMGSTLPENLFDEFMVGQMGLVVTRLFRIRESSGKFVEDADISFENYFITATKIRNDASVITVGETGLDVDGARTLASAHLAGLTAAIDELLERERAEEEQRRQAAQQRLRELALQPRIIAEAIGTVAPFVTSQLALALGPVAPVVFDECVRKWSKLDEPTPDALVTLLEKEIGRAGKRAAFSDAVRPLLREVLPGGPGGEPKAENVSGNSFARKNGGKPQKTDPRGTGKRPDKKPGEHPGKGAVAGPAKTSGRPAAKLTITAPGRDVGPRKKLYGAPELSERLTRPIKEELQKYLGPLAHVVFDESVERWQVDWKTADELIVLISKEIEDARQARAFRTKLLKLFKA